MPRPHPDDIPPVDHHPEDCCCFVCFCLRLESARTRTERLKNRKLCLV